MQKGKFLVTGATGLIGSALVKRLASDGMEIFCPVRSIEKAKSVFPLTVFNAVEWKESPLEVFLGHLSKGFEYIVHCASPTASRYFVEKPVETLRFNLETTTALLEYARKQDVRGMVYLSSLESYGTILDDAESVTEDVQGYVNPFESRSSYNVAKRTCESLCHAYAAEYGVPVKVVRLTQTISPDVGENDMRVFAQFARHAAKGEDIELHTEGRAARPYIHVDDAVDAILCVLEKGKPGEAYNAAREDSYISARDMAKFVQNNFNPSGKVVFHLRNDMGYAPTTKLRLNTDKLRELGWEAKHGLHEMFGDLISRMKEPSSSPSL